MAAEYSGSVKAGGSAFPGVTVTATQGSASVVTTTDERGRFHFADLADGAWTIEVRMLGFETLRREVGVASGAPAAEWDLKYLSESAVMAGLGVAQPAAAKQPQNRFQRVDVSQSTDDTMLAGRRRSRATRSPTSHRPVRTRSSSKAA